MRTSRVGLTSCSGLRVTGNDLHEYLKVNCLLVDNLYDAAVILPWQQETSQYTYLLLQRSCSVKILLHIAY